MLSINKINTATALLLMAVLLNCACTKTYLDQKPNKKQVVPVTIDDFQAILNNDDVFGNTWSSAGEEASDNGWVDYNTWQNLPTLTLKNLYIWDRDVFNDKDRNDWSIPYITLLNTNICLEGIDKINPPLSRLADWQNVKGSALFYRAFCFWSLAQEFAKLYDSTTAAKDPGIALRLVSDVNAISVRSTVKETYDRIIQDLNESISYLPVTPLYKSRPSKSAVYALLARTYLSMRKYREAGLYADSCLQLNSTLLDYNTLNTALANPLPRYNTEVLFHCLALVEGSFFTTSRYRVDSELYKSYDLNDLRKKAFFKIVTAPNTVYFCGSYDGSSSIFGGFTTAEMMLTKAECLARAGFVTESMALLNNLLQKRWKTGTWVPFTATSATNAVTLILSERRKELINRALRWTDLRRLNTETGRETTITRILNNQTYQLLPGDKRYVFPIPQTVINFSGMAQNE